jgi:uncharacterized protein YbjT (DUF2867 family)
MSPPTQTVFVVGATGTQGEAVARRLRTMDWAVHATVRDLSSPAAKGLASLGVELTVGDWDDQAALTAAIAGCSKLFLNMIPSFTDMSAELVQVKRILAIAKTAGVTHVIYSSALSVNHPEILDSINKDSIVAKAILSKGAIEAELKGAGFDTWTIIRGGFFMQNFLVPKIMMYPGFVESSRWTTALTPEVLIPVFDAEDMGATAAAVFQDPGRFNGKDIALASEKLTGDQVMEQLSVATGRELKAAYMTEEEINAQKVFNPFVEAQLVSRQMAEFVDLDEPKSYGIPLTKFGDFLEREKPALRKTFP